MRIWKMTAVAVALLAGTTLALAAASKDDAVAMVKKAVAAIKAEGAQKIYAEITTDGKFKDQSGEIYIVVLSFDGKVLANGANAKLVGKDMHDSQDVDGKYFVKDMGDLGRKQGSFWYDYKFVNPVIKKIQPKDTYCESIDQTIVCSGVYRS